MHACMRGCGVGSQHTACGLSLEWTVIMSLQCASVPHPVEVGALCLCACVCACTAAFTWTYSQPHDLAAWMGGCSVRCTLCVGAIGGRGELSG